MPHHHQNPHQLLASKIQDPNSKSRRCLTINNSESKIRKKGIKEIGWEGEFPPLPKFHKLERITRLQSAIATLKTYQNFFARQGELAPESF